MTAIADLPRRPPPPRGGGLLGFNLLTAIVLGDRRLVPRPLRSGGLIHGASIDSFSMKRGRTTCDPARLPVRRDRLPGRSRLRELPDQADARLPADRSPSTSPRSTGSARYFRLSHRPQGRLDAVHGRHRVLLLRRRAQRDADPHRAAAAQRHVFGANQYLTLVGMHGSMMMGMMTSGILGPFANWLVPLMIGSRRMAFPRIESLTFWLLMAGRRGPDHDHLLRRLPDRLDRLPAARRPGHGGLRRLHRLLRAGRPVDVPARPQPGRDDRHDARPGHDLVAAADLRVGGARDLRADGARGTDADRDAADGRDGPHRADRRSSSPAWAAAPTCARTCSGCSDTPRSTCSRCPASGSCSSCCPSSPASRCGATASRWRA